MSSLLGSKLKNLREELNLPQRQLAAVLNIDTATYCKIEKGTRRMRREQIKTIAKSLNFDEKQLIRLWSADKVYEIIANEEEATQILDVVAENITNYKRKTTKS